MKYMISLLFGAGALATMPPYYEEPHYNVEQVTKYTGTVVKEVANMVTWGDCEAQCKAADGCVAWAWTEGTQPAEYISMEFTNVTVTSKQGITGSLRESMSMSRDPTFATAEFEYIAPTPYTVTSFKFADPQPPIPASAQDTTECVEEDYAMTGKCTKYLPIVFTIGTQCSFDNYSYTLNFEVGCAKNTSAADCPLKAPGKGQVLFTVNSDPFCTDKSLLKCTLLSSVAKRLSDNAYVSGYKVNDGLMVSADYRLCVAESGTALVLRKCTSPEAEAFNVTWANDQYVTSGKKCLVAAAAEVGAAVTLGSCKSDLSKFSYIGNSISTLGENPKLCLNSKSSSLVLKECGTAAVRGQNWYIQGLKV